MIQKQQTTNLTALVFSAVLDSFFRSLTRLYIAYHVVKEAMKSTILCAILPFSKPKKELFI